MLTFHGRQVMRDLLDHSSKELKIREDLRRDNREKGAGWQGKATEIVVNDG